MQHINVSKNEMSSPGLAGERRALRGPWAFMPVVWVALALAVSVARAEWKTETYELVPGWNAVYLHVDPSYEKLDVLLQRTPVSQVWLWAPSVSTAQFVTSVQDNTSFGSNWIDWAASDSANSSLQHFIGNAAYLVYVDANYHDGTTEQSVSNAQPFTLSLRGKAVPPTYNWTASGQNFIGFPTRAGNEPSFENFFGLAETLDSSATEVYQYTGGELGSANPLLVDAPVSTKVTRGQAFWVKDSDFNRFFGTFSLTLQDASGVHFGSALSAYRIRLSNTSNERHTVTMEMVASELPADGSVLVASPPILVRGDLDATTLTYGFADLATSPLSYTLEPTGQIGSSVEVVLGIDRAAMATTPGDIYGAIVRFTDDFVGSGYTQIDVPATAVTASMSGLWVGEAEISQVKHDLAEYAVDEDGATALNEDGSAVVSATEENFGGVAREFPLRLILHMSEDGTTQLLQRVYYGLDENALPILATRQGVLNGAHLDVARRITSIHLPWSESNLPWLFDNSLNFVSEFSTTVTTGFGDQAANPFLHTYHPDHDNRSPAYEEYGDPERGFESFDIVREITLISGTKLIADSTTSTSTSAETTETEVNVLADLPAGIRMIDVPEGSFVMGNEAAVGPLAADHTPERDVNMSAFEMSEAEITNQQYVEFLNAAYADGLITVTESNDGTFVYGATDQPYAGHKFLDLSGSRVLKDHDGDGDVDPENPLNQCWIEFDGNDTFSVKDPFSINWENFEYYPIPEITPLSLVEHGGVDGDGEAYDLDKPIHVVVQNGIAYVCSLDSDTVTILNISNPSAPDKIGQLTNNTGSGASDQLGDPSYMTLDGDLLFVSATDGADKNVMIYNVADPANPVQKARLRDNVAASHLQKPRGTAVLNDRLYVAADENHALVIFDIGSILDGTGSGLSGGVVLLNQIIDEETQNGYTFSSLRSARWVSVIEVDQKVYAYVLSGSDHALTIIDVTVPASPILVAEIVDGSSGFNQISGPRSLILDGDVGYLTADGDSAVTIFDISDPSSPSVLAELVDGVGLYQSLAGVQRPALSNGLLFLPARTDSALTVVDVSNPSAPELLGVFKDDSVGGGFPKLGGPFSVAVDGSTLFVVGLDDDAVSIFDISDESIADWPELSGAIPSQSEVADWPAAFIKWHGAKAFAEYYGCDLPTEAQWEYAAKGGADLEFATADGTVDATKANYNENNLHPDTGHLEAVKSYSPNPFGFYDMSGNVWEWCRDWYDPDFYANRPDPDYGPVNESFVLGTEEPIENFSFVGGPGQSYNGDARVKRGGSWNFHETSLNTAERERDYTWRGNDHFGFRIVKESFSIAVNEADDFNSLTSTSTTLTGTYQEKITLYGKDNEAREYNVAGEFNLIRVSDIDTLRTE